MKRLRRCLVPLPVRQGAATRRSNMRNLGFVVGLVLSVGVLPALAGCGSGTTGGSADDETSMSEFVKDWDFGSGNGRPDSASCTAAGGDAFECMVTFGPKTFSVLATVGEDGKTVDLALTPEQAAICKEVMVDVRHLQRIAAQPIALGEKFATYLKQGPKDTSQVRRFLTQSANAFATHATRLATYSPRSDWGRDAKPALLASSQESARALQDLLAGRTDPSSLAKTLSEASQATDAQIATVPCPTDGASG